MLKKKLLVTTILAGVAAVCMGTAYAAAPGFYIGGQIGYSNTHYGASDFTSMTSSNVKSTGFGYRPFIGYQFDQNWAVEGGYTGYADAKFRNIQLAAGNTVAGGATTLADGKVRQYAWDLVAKGMWPFDNGFGIYGKAGAAYVRQTSADGMNGVYSDVNKWRPTAGIGGSYDFNQNVTADISWARVFKGSGIENADLIAAGVGYHFG
jgi:hypothetical protein